MAIVGNQTQSGIQRTLDGAIRGYRVTMPENGQAGVTITAYLEDAATGDSFRAAVIRASDWAVLATSTIRTDISTAGEYTFSGNTLATFSPASGTNYVLCVASNSASGAYFWFNQVSPGTSVGFAGNASISSIDPLTLGGDGGMTQESTRDYTAYMTYTAAGGVTPTASSLTTLGVQ